MESRRSHYGRLRELQIDPWQIRGREDPTAPNRKGTEPYTKFGTQTNVSKGTVLYQVKWLGYEAESDLTWEPADHL